MGTSSDYSGSTGGPWTRFKRAATDFAKYGGEERARRVMARHVATLGGARRASESAKAGISTAQRLGEALTRLGTLGLDATLQSYNLDYLIGKDRFDVLQALIEIIAPPGTDLESEAARNAALDVIEEVFGEGNSYEDLSSTQFDHDGLVNALELFIAAYVYNRAIPLIEKRLSELSAGEADNRDKALHIFIKQLVRLRLKDMDPLQIDWKGTEGHSIIQRLIRGLYSQLESWDE
ncbi:MAG: hypothetical protein AB1384_08715 [Actinomycetota bacterium]